jgi:hypothetical protein
MRTQTSTVRSTVCDDCRDLPDPVGMPVDLVRPVLDDIDRRAGGLLDELLLAASIEEAGDALGVAGFREPRNL